MKWIPLSWVNTSAGVKDTTFHQHFCCLKLKRRTTWVRLCSLPSHILYSIILNEINIHRSFLFIYCKDMAIMEVFCLITHTLLWEVHNINLICIYIFFTYFLDSLRCRAKSYDCMFTCTWHNSGYDAVRLRLGPDW